MSNNNFTHFNAKGDAVMVDIANKDITARYAVAKALLYMSTETQHAIKNGSTKKGDVLGVARIAGIMAAKKTPDIIPLCHPIMLQKITIDFAYPDANHIEITALCSCHGKTGVEMEAMHAASATALTIYDMVKAVERDMVIKHIALYEKDGGKSGLFRRDA